jgi:methyl-accepting chemotaxis protein
VTRIRNVVSLISNIAGLTTLLAPIATIKPARTGEAGRGSAIVAAEMKELASQTTRAIDEMSQKVGTARTDPPQVRPR